MDEVILRAAFGGIGVALVAGPLGAFVVWRRMAYFGATLAHGALLGVALGVVFEISLTTGILAVCLGLAVVLALLERQKTLSTDTLLGILAHVALALGLVLIAFSEFAQSDTAHMDLESLLFGDILAVTTTDLALIYGGGGLVLAILVGLWRQFLLLTVDSELARVEGVAVERLRLVFMLMLALVVALSMKIVGLLLIVSLLIIPAAAARWFSRTPEQMALGAAALGCLSVAVGLWGASAFAVPSGPAIVLAAAGFLALSALLRRRRL